MELWEEDPTSAARLDYQLREQTRQIDDMKSKAKDAYTKQYNEYLDTQRQLAAAKIPEYSDPNKADQFRTDMRTLDAATDRLSGPNVSGDTTFQSSSDQMIDADAKAHLISQARSLVTDLRRMPDES